MIKVLHLRNLWLPKYSAEDSTLKWDQEQEVQLSEWLARNSATSDQSVWELKILKEAKEKRNS